MLAVPTTRISILRGTTSNAFGDVLDDNTNVIARDIPASILTGPRTSQRPVDGTPRVIRYKTCRLPGSTDVRVDDRIRNQRNGDTYTVDEITQPENVATTTDLHLKLRRVT